MQHYDARSRAARRGSLPLLAMPFVRRPRLHHASTFGDVDACAAAFPRERRHNRQIRSRVQLGEPIRRRARR
jgi:hypothetical protein